MIVIKFVQIVQMFLNVHKLIFCDTKCWIGKQHSSMVSALAFGSRGPRFKLGKGNGKVNDAL